MLAFYIIADIVTRQCSISSAIMKKPFYRSVRLYSLATIALCKISLAYVTFKRISNRVINLFNLRSFKISTQKNFLKNFKFLKTPTRNFSSVSIICRYVNMRFMRNCPPVNFSGDSRQLAATAQNFRNKNF